MQKDKVFLIGPMGAGKSTIGRLLAKELSLPFKDSDAEIEARTGADIPWIFDVEGESGFRDREEAMVDELSNEPSLVLATGGGAVLRENNRKHLSGRGTVVYLQTTVDQQLKRTASDRNRPLLNTDDRRATLEQLMHERGPLYESIADFTISSGHGNPRTVVNAIKKHLKL